MNAMPMKPPPRGTTGPIRDRGGEIAVGPVMDRTESRTSPMIQPG